MFLPDTPEMITKDWLGQILGRTVSDVRLTRIGKDESFTGGRLYRVEFDGVGRETLVLKLSPSDPELRVKFARANRRDVGFYGGLGHSETLPIPAYYFGATDPDTGASLLLMEDLTGADTASFLTGCSAEKARQVVAALAQTHAAFWDDPALSLVDGLEVLDEFDFGAAWAIYPKRLAGILSDMTLPQSFLSLGDWIAENIHSIFSFLSGHGPVTCLHRDAQLDNVLFTQNGAILLDWQFWGKGCGAYDLCYFMASSLTPDQRRACEDDLIHQYHQQLLVRGVANYSFARCRQDYVIAIVGKIFLSVVMTSLFSPTSDHKIAWRHADLLRVLAFCEDHCVTPDLLQAAINTITKK